MQRRLRAGNKITTATIGLQNAEHNAECMGFIAMQRLGFATHGFGDAENILGLAFGCTTWWLKSQMTTVGDFGFYPSVPFLSSVLLARLLRPSGTFRNRSHGAS